MGHRLSKGPHSTISDMVKWLRVKNTKFMESVGRLECFQSLVMVILSFASTVQRQEGSLCISKKDNSRTTSCTGSEEQYSQITVMKSAGMPKVSYMDLARQFKTAV